MRYVFLPLDDRPCTRLFPQQLASAAGVQLTVPQDMTEKDFRAPYPYEKSSAFLEENAGDGVRLVVSAEQLCFGGLIQARSLGEVDKTLALERLGLLRSLKTKYPGMQVHVFSVIMRSSISTLRKEDIVHYNNMTLYSQAYHRAHLTGEAEDRAALEDIASRIPEKLLQEYHQVRDRDHAVNMACIHMAQEGVLDSLVLMQEDSQPFGVHRLEQMHLLAQMQKKPGNTWLHNGTDEAGSQAVLRVLAQDAGVQLRAAVRYLRGDTGAFTALYEDRPFCENLRSHLAYMGIQQVSEDEADAVVLILSPRDDQQKDIPDNGVEMDDAATQRQFARTAAALHRAGKKLYLLDLTFANGALPGLLQAIDEEMGLDNLWGYSAWNTTCNALGTLLAHLVSDQIAGRRNVCYFWERVLDDCLYQGVMRARLRQRLLERGEEVFALHDRPAAVKLLHEMAEETVAAYPFCRAMPCTPAWTLPWPRVFECGVCCTLK